MRMGTLSWEYIQYAKRHHQVELSTRHNSIVDT